MSSLPMTLPVSGLSCGSCAARLQRHLEQVSGITQAQVNLATAQATVHSSLPLDAIITAVEKAGFRVPEQKATLTIRGLSCASCVRRAETALAQLTGIRQVEINLANSSVTMSYVAEQVDFQQMNQAVQAIGFELLPSSEATTPEDRAEEERQKEYRELRQRLTISGVLLAVLLLLDHGAMMGMQHWLDHRLNHLLQALVTTPLQWWVGWYFHRSTLTLLRHGAVNMHTLVSIGTFSAYGYSLLVLLFPEWFYSSGMQAEVYFETAGSIIVLILLGRFLEARARGRTSQAIRQLVGQVPKQARVMRGNEEIEIPLAHVLPGDRVVIRPGERVPVDGTVLEGESTIDESMITGESIPVLRRPGDPLIGGTVNGRGALLCTATRVGQSTLLAQIVALVRQAQQAKPPIAHLADRIAAIFVPVVLLIASLTFLAWWYWGAEPSLTHALLSAVAVLIIACPCALGLATPTSILVGTGRGAELGILIRGNAALETAHRLSCVVFDKTGTLTTGKPTVTDWSGSPEDLAFVATAERSSEHPIAAAIVAYAKQEKLALHKCETFAALPGQGVQASIAGREVLVGTQRLLHSRQIVLNAAEEALLQRLEQEGKTALLAAIDGKVAGVLAVADVLRPSSQAAVATLHSAGIKVALLTGDNRRTAQAIAAQLAIKEVLAEVLPGDKANEIARLQQAGEVVAMVGDGINDAPALARADVGIAMATGTDVAMEAADITLMHSDPQGVALAIQLSRATMNNIRQNLFWAFAYNLLLIPLAAGAWYPLFGWQLSPVIAAAAMGLSSVTVVSNALRLRHFHHG
ncbi:heavy metal translocating P-type ATPase [Candidatus Magnetaquicoccus inordinatus]|uniref:heavy metal translocating P-type ATPase n=1 Tax=Candidatus Magnetaquicoccus inordinatus TaxID=2496818 RepID=UPI00102C7600|nr:copper-translocating P-type ATPase [Candidatus Magnetaquicoccus inordinatus]